MTTGTLEEAKNIGQLLVEQNLFPYCGGSERTRFARVGLLDHLADRLLVSVG